MERLTREVDHWVDDGLRAQAIDCCTDPARHGPPSVMELELPRTANSSPTKRC
ncbi:hypothetical protein ACFQ0M_40205 [Kitasatospora aburaviensis]